MANASPARPEAAGQNKKLATFLGIGYSILINGVLPFIIYTLLKNYTHVSDLMALFASGIPPIIDSIVSVIRKGHVDIIAGMALIGIAVSIILIFLGGSPRLYLIRESFFTAAFGLAYLVSLLFPRPMAFYFARAFVTGNVPAKVAWFNSLWQYPNFRHTMRVSTVVWGIGFLLEVAIRTYLVFTLTIPQFLVISPFVFYGFLGGLIFWNFAYSRKAQRRAEAIQPGSTQTPETASN